MHLTFPGWASRDPLATFIAIPVLAAWVLIASHPTCARGTTVLKLDDDDLVRLASLVVEGQVTGVHSEWNSQHTQIQTVVTISVSSVFKGSAPANGVLTLHLLGGRVDDTIMEIVGAPTFETGEDVILFLDGDGSGPLPIIGLFQGKFDVVSDPVTGTRAIAGRAVSLDVFVGDLKARVAAQKAGR